LSARYVTGFSDILGKRQSFFGHYRHIVKHGYYGFYSVDGIVAFFFYTDYYTVQGLTAERHDHSATEWNLVALVRVFEYFIHFRVDDIDYYV
jgi:hypothetical protein